MSLETSAARSQVCLGVADAVSREIDRGQVAGVVAVARTDQERNEVAGLDRETFDRPDVDRLAALRHARGKPPPRRPAPEFERPGHAVAALRMSVRHRAVDAESSPTPG